MKNVLLAVVLTLLASFGWAALSDYTFVQSAATYTDLTAPTMIHAAAIDDAMSPVTDIGFSFTYDEVVYTQFKANSNGFITLNPASSASLSNALATQTLIIAGVWDDLKTNDGDGQVAYLLSGTAPNRVLTVEYKNVKWYYNASPVNLINFQIKLYEGSNRVEIVYGTMGATPGTSASASIGLSGATAGNFISITPASPTATYSTTTEFTAINGTHVPFLNGIKYEFIPPVPAVNDLAATAISGNQTPSVGTVANYTVTVLNRGSAQQSTYTVKLVNSTGTTLASVAGPVIAGGTTAQVVIPWTPTTQGDISIRGKVELTGDENPANDQTGLYNVSVQPAGVVLVTIGEGSQNARMPLDFFYKNSLNQTLYFPTEMGMFGNITAVTLYNQFTTATLQDKPVKIWMSSTDLNDLSAGWIPGTSMTLVFDGTVSFPAGTNTITIPLQVPFAYSGGNLAVMFNRPMDTVYFSSSDYFKCQTVGTNRARYIVSDSITYDPFNPGALGTLTGQFAKTTFHMTPLSPDPMFSVTPASKNYGTVIINTVNNQTFTVMNAGGGTLVVNNISISGSPFFTLQNLPTLPVSLSTGQSATFVGRYNPTEAGSHTGTITISDNRMQHTVALSGNAVDTTIYTLPYNQNFDTVTIPALPIDWSRIFQSTSSGYVQTTTTAPYSTPNCVGLSNSADIAAQAILIAPPLANNIAPNTVRVKFFGKGGTNYTLKVGMMTDPTDPATFQEMQSLVLPAAWTQQVVSFAGYTGNGRFIAFKHGNYATYHTLYIDNVEIELIAQNDLACTALTGNTAPSVNTAATYTASVYNWGSVAQSTYTVKLYNAAGTELASAAGVTVAPAATVQVPITWTPTQEGPVTLYAKVILAGDQNPSNDQSPNLSISVMPAGMVLVTVGDGSQTLRMPLDFFYKNSLNQTLYFPNEIGMYGNITAISLYNQFVTTTLQNKPTKIWLGSTQLNDLSGGWVPISDMTLVYDGTVNYPAGENTILIPLQTVYQYAGGNLVVMFNRPMDTVYFSSSDLFKGQTVGTNRTRNVFSDSTVYDPANPGTVGTVSGQFAKTTFHMTPLGTDPIFSITPASRDFGTVLLGATPSQTFTVMNLGGGTLSVNSVSIAGNPFFTLENLPTLPVNLTTGQSTTFMVRYSPTAAGTHTATVTITDNRGGTRQITLGSRDNNNRMPHTVALSGNCIDTTVSTLPYTQNFDGVTATALPVDWSFLITPASATAAVGTYATGAYSAPNCARIYNGSTAGVNTYLIAPPLAQTLPVNTTRVKFWVKGVGATYTLQVGVMTDPTNNDSFTSIQTITTPTTWTEFIVSLNGYTGNGRFIAFKHGNVSTGQSIYVDNVTIELIAANDLGATAITGNTTPSVGVQYTYNVSILNWGTAAQNTYTVKLFNSANEELATAPGTAVAPGQTVQIPLNWTPQTSGAYTIYGKVFLTGDQNNANDQSPNLNLAVNPAGVFSFTVGEGNQSARVPVDMYYKNSLFQTMYYPAEMDNFMGMITGLQFYNNFTTATLQNMPTKVWIGTTTQAQFAANGWIPASQLTLVFDGTINYPAGQNVITIPFTAPYMYLNGENLVIMVNRPMDTVYYSSSDNFYCQTIGTARSLKIVSDSTTYDPANPPTTGATLSGQFPKTTFLVIPGGVGHVNGTVLGVGNQPVAGASVSINAGAYTATTNTAGQYQIQNVLPGNYSIQFSAYGYITQSQNFVLEEDETEVINVTLAPMPTVNVTGTIIASDTGAGLSGASIQLNGYSDYTANSTATGSFTIPAVYANQPYSYIVMAPGYTNASGNINVGASNHNMGNITLNEIAFAPLSVVAVANDTNSTVNLNWLAPDPNALNITESFEGVQFPPAEWTQTVTNTGPANTLGVLPTWCRFGAITISGQAANPTDGTNQAGVYWDYNHQDEWLITPSFNCPPSGYLRFDTYAFLGSTNQDHYYVKISTDNGANWTVLWDASTQTGGWNYYASPITVDLNNYSGQQVKLAFHATDGPGNDGLWYVWFIDNIYIGNATTAIRFAGSDLSVRSAGNAGFSAVSPTRAASRAMELGGFRSETRLPLPSEVHYAPATTRALTGYKVWRFLAGQENNEASWTLLTADQITGLTHADTGWNSLPNGSYRWAVKAIYTNGVSSVPALSNVLIREMTTGMIAGVVRRQNTTPIAGATVSASGVNATTNSAGAYTLVVPVGIHSVTATATGFAPQTIENVTVNQNLTTTVNFVLVPPSSNDDDVVPVTATALNGNFPNPFNPETTISFAVKEPGMVKIEIYNVKGQVIRTLVNNELPSGNYKTVFNGKDDRGNAISSGVYFYKMTAGSYTSTKKMILMQ